jgi:L-aminopeptidase/D-esterase-like protein
VRRFRTHQGHGFILPSCKNGQIGRAGRPRTQATHNAITDVGEFVVTDAVLTSEQINHLATCGHDGRHFRSPFHTTGDGDTVFGLATGGVAVEWREVMLGLVTGAAEVKSRSLVASRPRHPGGRTALA